MRDLKLFGASYAAGILGDPDIRMQPIDVYLAMIGEPPLQDLSQNKRVKKGKQIENYIIDSFEIDHGVKMERGVTFYSPNNELYCCSPDGVDKSNDNGNETWLEKGICLEVKNVASDKAWRYSQGVPKAEFCQIQWQAKIINEYLESIGKPELKLNQVVLRALIGGNEDIDFWTPVDEGFIFNLTEVVDDFVETYIKPKKEPPPDSSKAYADFLFRKFPEVAEPEKKELLEISKDSPDYKLIGNYFNTRSQIESLETYQQKNENEIKALIGFYYGLDSPLGKILWGMMKGSCRWKSVAEYMFEKHKTSEKEKAEIIAANTGETTRFFRPYPKK